MSEPTETLFEIDVDTKKVFALGIPLDAPLDKIKVIINDIEIKRTMKISSLKIVKEY